MRRPKHKEVEKTVQGLTVSKGRNKCSVPGNLAPKPTKPLFLPIIIIVNQ